MNVRGLGEAGPRGQGMFGMQGKQAPCFPTRAQSRRAGNFNTCRFNTGRCRYLPDASVHRYSARSLKNHTRYHRSTFGTSSKPDARVSQRRSRHVAARAARVPRSRQSGKAHPGFSLLCVVIMMRVARGEIREEAGVAALLSSRLQYSPPSTLVRISAPMSNDSYVHFAAFSPHGPLRSCWKSPV